MTARPRTAPTSRTGLALGAVAAAFLVVTTGCQVSPDEEMVPPTRTVTASPSVVPVAPTAVPVGAGKVSLSDPVWAQDNTLHVGTRLLDLSPVRVDSLVAVPGGVFLVDHGELRFTDLSRVRSTGLVGATRVSTTPDGHVLRVEMAKDSGPVRVHAYDVRSGAAVPLRRAPVASQADLLGTPVQITLRRRPGQAPAGPVAAWVGPGGQGVVDDDTRPLVAFDSASRRPVPLRGVVGNGFEMVRWTSATRFYGLALEARRPESVLGCDLRSRACTTFGRVDPHRPVVFESSG